MVVSLVAYFFLAHPVVCYMDHFSASSYTRVTYCQKWSEFSWLKLIGIFGAVGFLQIYAKNI